MKIVLLILLLTPSCFPAPIISGVLETATGWTNKLPDVGAVVGSVLYSLEGVLKALPSLLKVSKSLNGVSDALTKLAKSPNLHLLTGGDLSKIGFDLDHFGLVIFQTQDSASDLNLLELNNLDHELCNIAESVDKLTATVNRLLYGATAKNDPISIEAGLLTLEDNAGSFADVIYGVQGPGAMLFGTAVNVAGLNNALRRTSEAFAYLNTVDSSKPFKQVSDAVLNIRAACIHLLNLVIN